ncbi:MAG: hypothetical protein IH867_02800 [Chloroflexi bacterium]|nr:hypothetical protein [Chloroflexota bacterium]
MIRSPGGIGAVFRERRNEQDSIAVRTGDFDFRVDDFYCVDVLLCAHTIFLVSNILRSRLAGPLINFFKRQHPTSNLELQLLLIEIE